MPSSTPLPMQGVRRWDWLISSRRPLNCIIAKTLYVASLPVNGRLQNILLSLNLLLYVTLGYRLSNRAIDGQIQVAFSMKMAEASRRTL